MTKHSCYVFGTGLSLLRTPSALKEAANKSSRVLSMNSYLLHWRQIGIQPTHHIVLDDHCASLAAACISESRRSNITQLFLSDYLSSFFQYWPPRALRKNLRRRRAFRKRPDTDPLPLLLAGRRVESFSYRTSTDLSVFEEFATRAISNAQGTPLPHFRGTLTSAIVRAHQLWPDCNIVLCGIDLDAYHHFYDQSETAEQQLERIARKSDTIPSVVHQHHAMAIHKGVHATNLPMQLSDGRTIAPVSDAVRVLTKLLEGRRVTITSANPESMLVHDGAVQIHRS
jgi:hypothetical protein